MTSRIGGQSGFALLAVMGFLLVLSLIGVTVVKSVRNDSTYSGRDLSRVRADFAAESAVQWAMTEILRTDAGRAALTLSTHNASGDDALPEGHTGRLDAAALAAPKGVKPRLGEAGWIVAEIKGKEMTFSGGESETVSFKVWYPDDKTVRISGRATVDGITSKVNFRSNSEEVVSPI